VPELLHVVLEQEPVNISYITNITFVCNYCKAQSRSSDIVKLLSLNIAVVLSDSFNNASVLVFEFQSNEVRKIFRNRFKQIQIY
jgi:hypothetical protein